jgi:beta-phosphoglucomutase
MFDIKKETHSMDRNITPDKILFFDMDGTLIDTNLANFLAYRKAIQSITKSEIELKFNPDCRFNRSNLKTVFPNLTEIEYERITKEKERCYKDFLHETKLNNDFSEILFKYSETNRTYLVTNCRTDRAILTINHHRLKNKFTNLFCREIVEKDKKINKYQNAISKLGVSPKIIIAFEDEECEIIDARKAGITVINPINL